MRSSSHYSKQVYKGSIRKDEKLEEINIKFDKAESENKVPWAKVIFSTDNARRLKIYEEVKGEKIEGFRVGNHGLVFASTMINGKESKIEPLSFTAEFIDSASYWHGILSVNGLYRFINNSKFEVYVPLKINGSIFDLIVFEGSFKEKQIFLNGKSLNFMDDKYKKAPLEETKIKFPEKIFNPTEIQGIRIAKNIYINTGVTTYGSQNVRFRLQGKKTLGDIKETEWDRGRGFPFTISSGANPIIMGEEIVGYEYGLTDSPTYISVP